MEPVKSKLVGLVRWGWFGLLVLLAFSYLVSGLSGSDEDAQTPVRTVSSTAASSTAASSTGTSSTGTSEQSDQRPLSASSSLDQAVAQIDKVWEETLAAKNLQAAPLADWMTVSRRASLALVGNGLSLEEIRELEKLPVNERESAHIENLLVDTRFHHYWAERWARFLVGTDGGQFLLFRRRRFRIWLAEVFQEDWRYDRLVRQLITAEGLWTDQPAVNFYSATFDSNGGQPDPVRLAARTSRAFLGLRIDCLQCHDDFLGNVSLGDVNSPREGLQTDFHQLAAFFTGATTGLRGLVNRKPEYKYKYLDADEEVDVQPAVPYSPELLPEQGNARRRLARWITSPENRQAGRCAVSHVWALMYGRAAGESVDSLPLDEKSDPIIEALTDDFIENGFNLRRLVRLIVRSKAFRVESRADFAITTDHEDAAAVFPLVRLRPEQMAGTIIQSGRIKATDRDSSFFLQLQRFGGINDFVKRYGDIGEDEFSKDSATITQRLVMLNGKMLREIVNGNPILNASAHINMFAKDDAHAVDIVYLSVLNRYPAAEERTHFINRLGDGNGRAKAIEDLMWVLLNSSELSWNH